MVQSLLNIGVGICTSTLSFLKVFVGLLCILGKAFA